MTTIYLIQKFNEFHEWMETLEAYIEHNDAEENCNKLNKSSKRIYYKVEAITLHSLIKGQ